MPIREPAVRAIEASGSTGLGCQGAFAAEGSFHQFGDAQPGRSPEIIWGDCMASQQIGDLAMPPEQRSDQRRASCAVRFGIQRRSFCEQDVGDLRFIRVRSLMERRPAAIIRVVRVGTCRQQRFDRRHAAFPVRPAGEADGEIQQSVAIRPALACQSGIGAQQRFDAGYIPRLQCCEGRHEWLGRSDVRARRQ